MMQIWEGLSQTNVDLFTPCAQSPLFFSLAVLAHPWPSVLLYMFPPLSLISPSSQREGSSPIYCHGRPTLAEATLAGGDNPAACRAPLATVVAQESAILCERGKFQPPSSAIGLGPRPW